MGRRRLSPALSERIGQFLAEKFGFFAIGINEKRDIELFIADEGWGGLLEPAKRFSLKPRGADPEIPADIAVSAGALFANKSWRSSVNAAAHALGSDGILIVREIFNPSWAPWIGPLLWNSFKDFTWSAFVDHCRVLGLEMLACRRFFAFGEAIFIRL